MATFLLKRTTLVIALAFAPAAFAQPATGADPAAAEGTTLNQVIEQTLLSNPEIQAKYHDFQSSLEGQSVARAAFFPQVNAQGYVGREYRNNVPGVGSQQWSRPGYNLELRQLIFDGFRTSNDVKQAGFDKLAASMTCWPPATPPRWPPPRPISTCSATATWSCWRARTIRCTKKRSSRSASAPNRAWAAAWIWNRPAAAWPWRRPTS